MTRSESYEAKPMNLAWDISIELLLDQSVDFISGLPFCNCIYSESLQNLRFYDISQIHVVASLFTKKF